MALKSVLARSMPRLVRSSLAPLRLVRPTVSALRALPSVRCTPVARSFVTSGTRPDLRGPFHPLIKLCLCLCVAPKLAGAAHHGESETYASSLLACIGDGASTDLWRVRMVV